MGRVFPRVLPAFHGGKTTIAEETNAFRLKTAGFFAFERESRAGYPSPAHLWCPHVVRCTISVHWALPHEKAPGQPLSGHPGAVP